MLAAGTGFFAYRYAHPAMQQQASAASSAASSAALPAVSSSASAAPQKSAPAAGKASAVSPAVSSGTGNPSDTGKIQKAVPLDWKRYTLKPSAAKVVKNKTYRAYDIIDGDYLVGPKILVDSGSGAVYTWAASDAAPVPAAEDKAFDKTQHSLVGTVEDGAMMNVVLKTESGNELIVRRVGVDTSGLTSMKVGDKIRVTYTGVISGNDTSRAFITKLETVK